MAMVRRSFIRYGAPGGTSGFFGGVWCSSALGSPAAFSVLLINSSFVGSDSPVSIFFLISCVHCSLRSRHGSPPAAPNASGTASQPPRDGPLGHRESPASLTARQTAPLPKRAGEHL